MSKLRQELEKYSKDVDSYLAASNAIGIVLLDFELNIQDSNLGFMRLFNPRQIPVGEHLSDYFGLEAGEIQCGEQLKLPCSIKSGITAVNSCYVIRIENGYLFFCERQLLTESRVLQEIGCMNDELINLQRESVKNNFLLENLRKELAERVVELEAMLARVKHLEGIIPICSYCKKIRDDHNSWQQLEKYISDHSGALFSHSACPACLEEQMKMIGGIKLS